MIQVPNIAEMLKNIVSSVSSVVTVGGSSNHPVEPATWNEESCQLSVN